MKTTYRAPKALLAMSIAAVFAVGCADNPNQRALIGAGIGAIAGGVAGHQVDGDKGRYIGAAIGAIAGGAVGHYMDQQQAELERQLSQEAAAEQLRITRMADGSLRVGIASEASFDINSATVKPEFRNTYGKIASVLTEFPNTVVHIVGHTDSSGSDQHNQTLSEQRANAVLGAFVNQGIVNQRLRTEGRGEREPLATNTTTDGRSQNRRVDIVIKPLVEGEEYKAYSPPPYLGTRGVS